MRRFSTVELRIQPGATQVFQTLSGALYYTDPSRQSAVYHNHQDSGIRRPVTLRQLHRSPICLDCTAASLTRAIQALKTPMPFVTVCQVSLVGSISLDTSHSLPRIHLIYIPVAVTIFPHRGWSLAEQKNRRVSQFVFERGVQSTKGRARIPFMAMRPMLCSFAFPGWWVAALGCHHRQVCRNIFILAPSRSRSLFKHFWIRRKIQPNGWYGIWPSFSGVL
ncbi:hypothetical protein P171DRAFT_214678 [Karstenula rhodostoma CBS 690.94]|uniref:Uncharacterized protein n=1 Tax=Karstenula rhodostoma CBS 690.94 TaxID=1392251 RepID=A0A9P4PQU1_9PLEO|nr:hypothetical protein P171DRAFT_214678 [Karstenula rhodostoma CBS 690.94]